MNLPAMKARLTRALYSGSITDISSAVYDAFATFDREGYPDCWMNWQRALDNHVRPSQDRNNNPQY